MSFWLGLPAFLFLLWAWQDSMHRSGAWHIAHGTRFPLRWPPVDTTHLPKPAPVTAPELDRLDFDITKLPGELGPLSPIDPHPMPLIDDPFRSSNLTPMQPYWTLGSKGGALWFSSWISPRELPAWNYAPDSAAETWFPPLDWSHESFTRTSTAWIPYWLLTGSYLLAWTALIAWRVRCKRRRFARLTIG